MSRVSTRRGERAQRAAASPAPDALAIATELLRRLVANTSPNGGPHHEYQHDWLVRAAKRFLADPASVAPLLPLLDEHDDLIRERGTCYERYVAIETPILANEKAIDRALCAGAR